MRSSTSAMLAGTILGLGLIATPAFAQNGQKAAVPAERAKAGGGIQEIVVTARKRKESEQTVPVDVTAISAKKIADQDISSITKIATITPDFSVGRASNGSGAQLTMRGIGSSSTSIGIAQSVAVDVDGAYYGQGRIIEEGFFDIAGIQVLKGPQALFFGKNATAGVISITTKDPTPNWEFTAKAGYEFKAEQYRLEGIISGPITDRLGIRIGARYSKMNGGYYTNITTPVTYLTLDTANPTAPPTSHVGLPAPTEEPGEKEFLARATVKWEPTDRLTLDFKANYDYDYVNNSSWDYVAYACGVGTTTQLNGYPCGAHFITHQNNMPADIAANFPFAKKDGALYNRYKSQAYTLNEHYDANWLQISGVTNYQWNNNRWTCACDFQSSNSGPGRPGPTWATENSSWKAFSQELRFRSQFKGPLNFMIGGLYQRTRRDFDQYVMFAGFWNSAASPADQYIATSKTSYSRGNTLAVFGELTYDILQNLELSGGARYTHETKSSFFAQPYNNPYLTAIFTPESAPNGKIYADQRFNNVSPEVSLTWKATKNIMLYGAFKTAYKSGGFSNGGINSGFSADPKGDLTFNPEKAEGFEGGFKSMLFNHQLRFNVTLFNYKYKDLQVDFFNSPTFAFQTLTADARTKGVELTFEYAPYAVPGLDIHGSLNYDHARYTNFPLAPCYAGETPSEGCNLAGNTRQDLNGKPLSVAPDWTAGLGFGYQTEIAGDYKLGFGVDSKYSDSYLASAFGEPISKQNSYILLDANIHFGPSDGSWQFSVIGKNLTNQFYVSGVVDGPSTGGGTGTPQGFKADQMGFGSLPRTVMVQVSTHF